MKPSTVLKRALRLLEKRGGWTQGAYGRLADGTPVADATERGVVSCCAIGALTCAHPAVRERLHACVFLDTVIRGESLSAWNDDPARTKRQVLAAFRKAIKLAEGTGR